MLGEYDYAFPEEVQIWPPQQIVEKSYYIDEYNRTKVSDFVEYDALCIFQKTCCTDDYHGIQRRQFRTTTVLSGSAEAP